MPKKIYKELIEYICPECKKNFGNRKDNYETHLKRKNPCIKLAPEPMEEPLITPPEQPIKKLKNDILYIEAKEIDKKKKKASKLLK